MTRRGGFRSFSDVAGQLVRGAEQRREAKLAKVQRRYGSFKEFLLAEIHTDNGKYSFDGHRVFEGIVDRMDDVVRRRPTGATFTALKGAQIGFTTVCLAYSTFAVAEMGLKAIYYLPHNDFAKMVTQTRYQPMVRNSPLLSERAGVSKQGLMSFGEEEGERFLHVLGLETLANAISVPSDFNLYDEVDVISEENLKWSRDRLMASPWQLQAFFSVGMMPGEGIDKKYSEGCQYVWVVKCPRCGQDDQVVEELFPECARRIGDEWRLACVACGQPYNIELAGRWVAKHPQLERDNQFSYRVPSLIVPWVRLDGIMRRWEESKDRPNDKAKFECSVLARPNGGSDQPITAEVLDAVTDARLGLNGGKSNRKRVAGLDTGNWCHLSVLELADDGRTVWTYFERISSDQLEDRVDQVWAMLGLDGLVVDSAPLTTQARRIAYRHPGRVWLQTFPSGDEAARKLAEEAKGEHDGHEFQRVLVPRNLAIDRLVDGIHQRRHVLPSSAEPVMKEVRTHLENLKVSTVEKTDGSSRREYRHNVENHYALAMQMAETCRELLGLVPSGASAGPRYESVSSLREWGKGAW